MRKDDPVFIGGLDALCIHDTARRRCKILDTALPCPVNVIGEGEECVTRTCDPIQ